MLSFIEILHQDPLLISSCPNSKSSKRFHSVHKRGLWLQGAAWKLWMHDQKLLDCNRSTHAPAKGVPLGALGAHPFGTSGRLPLLYLRMLEV